jgi:Ca-activated chloride channel family protein
MVISPEIALLIVLFLSGAAELIHVLRCRTVSRLAFGPVGRPRRWTMMAPFLRMASMGLVAWGFVTLLTVDAKKFEAEEAPKGEGNRLIIAYDVSPSMYLKDAGPARDDVGRHSSDGGRNVGSNENANVKIERYVGADGSIMRKPTTRSRRAAELLNSVFDRINMQQVLVNVVAFYTGDSRVVLADCQDMISIRNVFNDLPLKYAFQSGETNVASGIVGAVEMARDWAPESTTLFVITDGGTGRLEAMPALPASIKNTIVVGVGKTGQGILLDGHYSRQETTFRSSLAQQLNGTYHDGNETHVPLESFESLAMDLSKKADTKPELREFAVLAIALGAFVFGLLPVALAAFGAGWRIRTGSQLGVAS